MKQIVFVQGACIAIVAIACGDQSASVCTAPHPLAAANGTGPQGFANNGWYANGINQGVTWNGLPNGISLNGAFALDALTVELAGTSIAELELQGARLIGTTPDGARVEGVDFEGARIANDLEITRAQRDDRDSDLVFYDLSFRGQRLCAEGENGVFVSGRWDERGAHHTDSNMITYACKSGVIHKCVTWGYKPWLVGADMHQTCTRLARADYCGDGRSHTENGTIIDIFDERGIQSPVLSAGFELEAAWGPEGAVCVAKTRYETYDANGELVLPSCWNAKPRCSDATSAFESGALIANLSSSNERHLCAE